MKPLFAKAKKLGWISGIVLGVFLLISCGNNDATLVITQCLDQDGTPLEQEVGITVNTESKIWKPGTECEFKIPVAKGSTAEIALEAEAGPDFFYNSPRQYLMSPKTSKKIPLRFFKAYTVDISAFGADERPLAGVSLSVDGNPIGLTDETGFYSWRIDRPDVKPGIKAGYQMKIELNKDGENTIAETFILAKGKFEYQTQGKLNVIEKPRRDFWASREAASGTNPGGRASSGTAARPESKSNKSSPPSPPIKKEEGAAVPKNFNIDPPASKSGFVPSGFMKEGEQAAEAGNYEAAITAYEKIANPGMAGNQQAVREYIEAQHRLGELFWKQVQVRDYQRAIESFQNIINVEPRAYYAFYNLAGVYYEIKDYVRCRSQCDQVIRLKPAIPVAEAQDIELQIRYLKAFCQYELYQKDSDAIRKRQIGLKCLSELRDFIDRVPADKSKFQEEKQDAEQKMAQIEAQMQ